MIMEASMMYAGVNESEADIVSVIESNKSLDIEVNIEESQFVDSEHGGSVTGSLPKCDDAKKPYLEQKFSDLDYAFAYYKEYGRVCGFDVRRSTEKSDRKGNTILKYFVCSRSGSNETKNVEPIDGMESYKHRTRRTVTIKCDCPAMIRVNVAVGGGFVLKKFVEEHNHTFASKDGVQFLRCNRSLTEFHKRFIFDAAKLNIGATRAHGIISAITGSYENVGATAVNFKIFSRDVKKQIGMHDVDMIIQKFKDIQSSSDGSFKFEYETDSKNHLTRLIWADGIGRQSYEVFGDVVSFDATYRTNKYGMVFVPLIGIDNHWKSVTFAGTLLESESSENFIWLCKAFKNIFGRDPKCIITDQCPAMKIAIDHVFPLVKHRLCMWHIMKKFPAKLGSLFCAESAFMDKLNKFVWCDHASPADFEHGWNEVISEFGLTNNKWLKEIYELRQSWIPAYFNDEPMLGLLRTTSRSESSNFYFNHFVQKGDTLSEFYICYDSAIAKQRNISKKLNHYDNIMPRTISTKEIEKDAAEQYTKAMFYKIQDQIIAGGGDIVIMNLNLADGVKNVVVRDPVNNLNTFEVNLNMDTHDIDCSCKLFTRVGFLCSHAFFVLGISGIHNIPRQYVKNRWLKKAEERFSTLKLGEISDPLSGQDSLRKQLQDCWFLFQSCVSEASKNQDHINFLQQGLNVISDMMKLSTKKGMNRLDPEMVESLIGSKIVEEITVLPPNRSNNKGCRKRLVNPAEKSLGGKKRRMRECQFCNTMAYHDTRNCPEKNK